MLIIGGVSPGPAGDGAARELHSPDGALQADFPLVQLELAVALRLLPQVVKIHYLADRSRRQLKKINCVIFSEREATCT